MSRTFDVAVVGATGAVGEVMLDILAQRDFPVGQVYPLASERSAGSKVTFKGRQLTVQNLAEFDFSRTPVGLFSAGASVSEIYAPKAAQSGCVVIDNTSQFRYDADIPLVVPEVNPDRIAEFERRQVPVDAYGVGSYLMRGVNAFTADVVLLEGKPCAKVGRQYTPNPRLELVQF